MSTNTLVPLTKTAQPDVLVPSYPLVFAQEPFLRLAIVYNPFDLSQTGKHELVYDQNKTLADYLEGIPKDVEWRIAVNGEVVTPDAWDSIKPQPFSNIAMVRIPEGGGKGGQGKSILRAVAMIALMVFAWWAAPFIAGFAAATFGITISTSLIASGIMMAGGAIINSVLGPAVPKPGKEESPTYGVDGAKNTSQEGVVVPVGYGDYRIGGNIVDVFTKNVGKEQYIYVRAVLNDGEIESIEDIEINDLPLSNFKDIQVRKHYGLDTETPNDWFSESTRMVNANIKIDQTWQERKTTAEVDRVRVDVVFPSGLCSIDQDDGQTKDPRTVTLLLEHIACDSVGNPLSGATWQTLPLISKANVDSNATYYTTPAGSTNYSVRVQTANDGTNHYNLTGYYRAAGDTTWISAGNMTGKPEVNIDWAAAGFANVTYPEVDFAFQFPTPGTYEVKVEGVGGATHTGASGTTTSATSLTITDKTNKAKRLSFESAQLTRGYYKVRIQRTTPQQTVRGAQVDYVYDEVWFTDLGEIDVDPVALHGIANLSIRALVSEQISGIPKITARCKLSKVNIYDEDGNVVDFAWSDNPADVAFDILHNTRRGAGYDTSKTMWSRYVEFREHCIANGYKFNGVFDQASNLWEAVQNAARVGHGSVISRGTKLAVAMDASQEPVALFTPANMFKDTFTKQWVGVQDRANEIQLEFTDAADNFKQKTIRLPNEAAFARGDKQKTAQVSGFGITDVNQAVAEAEYHVRNNQYIKAFIAFEAPLESIGLSIGEVALIQHDSIDFNNGEGGRLAPGSTTSSIKLDRPVHMEGGKQYLMLIIQDAVQRYPVAITSITGNRVTVTGLPDVAVDDLQKFVRLRQGAIDVEVTDVVKLSSTTFRISVESAAGLTNAAATLWDIDVIEERDVVYAAGDFTTVTLQSPLSVAPGQFANFMFGEKLKVKLPFRLRSIDGDGMERRKLSWVQYDERVYQPGSWGEVQIATTPTDVIGQAAYLVADYDRTVTPTQDRIPVTLNWQRPEGLRYGYAGADIYQDQDNDWHLIGSAKDSDNFVRELSRGEVTKFKVVVYDTRGNRARFSDAPVVGVTIQTIDQVLPGPTGLAYTVPYFRADATAKVTWTGVADQTSDTAYRIEKKVISTSDYNAFVAAGGVVSSFPPGVTSDTGYQAVITTGDTKADIPRLDVAKYAVRIRTERGFAISNWVYLPVDIAAPAIPTATTNLKLSNSTGTVFTTRDAEFVWDDIITTVAGASGITDATGQALVWKDYEVKVLTTAGALLRTEYTRSPSYSYSYDKNVLDAVGSGVTARRSFKIEVRLRGQQGQVSNPATITVSNPAPATTLSNITATAGGFTITPVITDTDMAGVMIWASKTSGFTPGSGNLVYSGPAPAPVTGLDEDVAYYYVWAAYDAFDNTALNLSPQDSVFTLHSTSQADAEQAMLEALNLLDQSIELDGVTSTLKAQIDGNRAAITTETAARVADGVAIAGQIVTINANIATNSANISNEAVARASGDSALSGQITTLTSTVSGNTVSISNNATAIATLQQVYGSIGFTVNANGNVAGMRLYASGGATNTSGVDFEVNLFRIKSAANTAVQPFTYDATTGKLFTQNLVANEVNANAINGYEFKVTGQIKAGVGDEAVMIIGSGSDKRIAVGNTTPELAPFSVDKTGRLVASKWAFRFDDGNEFSNTGVPAWLKQALFGSVANAAPTAASLFGSVVHQASTTSVPTNGKLTARLGDDSTVSIQVDMAISRAIGNTAADFSNFTLTVNQRYSPDGVTFGAWSSVGSQAFTKITSGSPTSTQFRVISKSFQTREWDDLGGAMVTTTDAYAVVDSPTTLSFTIAAASKSAGYYEYCVTGGNGFPFADCTSLVTLTDTDGTPSFFINGVASVGAVPYANPYGAFKSLRIASTSNTQLTISADWVVITTPEGQVRTIPIPSTTVNMAANGALGRLDTGTVAANTWYYLWATSNGTTDGVVASTSNSNHSLAGYRHKALLGAFRTDASGNIIAFKQQGRVANYTNTSTGFPLVKSGSHGNPSGTAPTIYENTSVANYVPPIATAIKLTIFSTGGLTMLAPNNTFGNSTDTTNPPYLMNQSGGSNESVRVDMDLEDQSIWSSSNHSSCKIRCNGWVLDI